MSASPDMRTTKGMDARLSDADARLRASVRDALASNEPAHEPSFERLWSNAARADVVRGNRRGAVARPAFAAFAVLIVLAGCVWLLRDAARVTRVVSPSDEIAAERASTPSALAADPDYRLAAQLAANFERPSPFDSLASRMQAPLSRGLPEISEYRYPLLPEEVPL